MPQVPKLRRGNRNRGLLGLTDERNGRVDPLWWGIALALGGIVGGMIVMLAG